MPRSSDIKESGFFGFLAQPDVATNAGVLMLPTIFGINAFMRDYANTLASAGLVAAACDHYEGLPAAEDPEEAKRRMVGVSDAKMHANAKAWIDYMFQDLKLESVGVIGFCIGGRYALMVSARDRRMAACAAAYPSIDAPRLAHQEEDALASAAAVPCPVLVLQPGHDHVAQPPTYAALKETLTGRSAPTVWHYYPQAEHGFMHRKALPANAAADAQASPQVIGFLQGCLLTAK
ncbi:MAG TPA: alpha/beta family hydrolase [Xanthobacteraceae bacterium]|jgi:carboxymethylenebutenolidase|nr:alpha/beta family hydrolase [Xanthobacteraceae bacterium]